MKRGFETRKRRENKSADYSYHQAFLKLAAKLDQARNSKETIVALSEMVAEYRDVCNTIEDLEAMGINDDAEYVQNQQLKEFLESHFEQVVIQFDGRPLPNLLTFSEGQLKKLVDLTDIAIEGIKDLRQAIFLSLDGRDTNNEALMH